MVPYFFVCLCLHIIIPEQIECSSKPMMFVVFCNIFVLIKILTVEGIVEKLQRGSWISVRTHKTYLEILDFVSKAKIREKTEINWEAE